MKTKKPKNIGGWSERRYVSEIISRSKNILKYDWLIYYCNVENYLYPNIFTVNICLLTTESKRLSSIINQYMFQKSKNLCDVWIIKKFSKNNYRKKTSKKTFLNCHFSIFFFLKLGESRTKIVSLLRPSVRRSVRQSVRRGPHFFFFFFTIPRPERSYGGTLVPQGH